MLVHGIASAISRDVEDFSLTRDEAEAKLAEVLRDAPELEGVLWVEAVLIAPEPSFN